MVSAAANGYSSAVGTTIKKIDKIDRAECRKHIEKYFTIEKMVNGYERAYEKLALNK